MSIQCTSGCVLLNVNHSLQDACAALDIEALAEIKLQPIWEACPNGQFELRQGYEYASLKARWASLHASSGLLDCEQESSCSPEPEVVEDGDRSCGLQTTSQAVPSQAVPSQVVPSQAVPSQAVPSQVVPSQAVPSQVVPSQDVPSSQEIPSAEFWLKGFEDNDIREMHFEDAFLSYQLDLCSALPSSPDRIVDPHHH